MRMKSTALAMGAGIGGVATAAKVARNGFHVTVLEKNDKPGGRVANRVIIGEINDGANFERNRSDWFQKE